MEKIKEIKKLKVPTEKEIIDGLKRSEDDVRNGRVTPAKEFYKEMEEKYGFQNRIYRCSKR